MKIIIKYLLRNIFQNKLRTILIIFSILLSSSLIFSTLTIKKTLEDTYYQLMVKNYGHADIVVDKNGNFFIPNDTSEINNLFAFEIKTAVVNAIYIKDANYRVSIQSHSLESLNLMHNVNYIKKDNTQFKDNNIIISDDVARKHKLDLGDKIILEINNLNVEFIIWGISKNEGYFKSDNNIINAIVSLNIIQEIYNVEGLVNVIFYKAKDNIDTKILIENLYNIYPNENVKETVSQELIDEMVNAISIPFSLMLVLVVFISIFIINTSFKVIAYERMPIIGTFRSVGATKNVTNMILFSESIILGIIGGLLGIGFGFIILKIMMINLDISSSHMIYSSIDILISLFGSLIIAIFGALSPIIKAMKIPVKSILLNNYETSTSINKLKNIIGFAFILIAIVLTQILTEKAPLLIAFMLVVGLILGIIYVIPILTYFLTSIFGKVNKIVFKNLGILAIKNIKTSRNIINNIILLVIGLSSLIMINTITNSIIKEIGNAYKDANYQITFTHYQIDNDILERILKIDGIDDISPIYNLKNIRWLERKHTLSDVFGVDESFFSYWDIDIIGENPLEKLSNGRFVLIGKATRAEIGEKITLQFGNKKLEYEVIGFADTLLSNGDIVIMSKSLLKEDLELPYYSSVLIKTSNEEELVGDLENEFMKEQFSIRTIREEQRLIEESNKNYFSLLVGFSIICLIIGIFGVINNFIVSYLSHKRRLALLRTIGMSKNQCHKMMLIEALNTGIIASLLSTLASLLLLIVARFVLKLMFLPITIITDYRIFIYVIISGIVITVIASISPVFKSNKVNLVEEIKCE